MKIKNDNVVSNSRTIPYSLIKQEMGSNTLVIILPGAGYSTQAPLLHYSTGLYANKGFDILHVNYKFTKEELAALSEEEFTTDILAVIEEVLVEANYTDFYLVAKSIGTIALTYLLEKPMFHAAKVVWLTPLLQEDDIYNSLLNGKNSGLCIIGSDDPYFIKERFDEINKNKNLHSIIIEGVDHSLQFKENTFGSINVLKDVIRYIDNF